jgi:coenzyme F420-dependent glucose-6-phosphate dehydrogenase
VVRYFLGIAHEQFPPSECLQQAVLGEEFGFDGIACSDHFQPWWEPGESGQAWVWLGAAAQATSRVAVGTAVTPALTRYHPALVAQAFATLEETFPGRAFLGIGSGESLNESPFGADWPSSDDQLAAMEEALAMIRRLWDGETVNGDGRFFATKQAKLHTRPAKPPPLYVSAFHEGAARLAARYGDGLWTLGDPEIAKDVIDAYKSERDDVGRDQGEIVVQGQFSWARTDEEAFEGIRVWKGAAPPEFYTDDWHDPQAMYEHAERQLSDDEFKEKAIVSADPDEHVSKIEELQKLEPTTVALMNCSGSAPRDAIRMYGDRVLPKLRG